MLVYPLVRGGVRVYGPGMRRIVVSVVCALALAGCGGGSGEGEAAPSATASARSAVSGLSAGRLVEGLAAKFEVPNPRDNTDFCRDSGCVQMVTTDRVSVYQFADEAGARRYADAMGKVGPVERVGVFVLSWAGRKGEELPSAKVRAGMIAEAKRLVRAG